MYLPLPTAKSCARAWVAAVSAVIDARNEAYNVVIDIDNPSVHDDQDNEVITLVDKFLRKHDENPIITVANTIFPKALLDAHGSPAFYDVYLRAFDSLSHTTKRWGRYFERMTRHSKCDGNTYNPLSDLIDKMKGRETKGVRYSSAYELAVYDPMRDGRTFRGGQCLSFLSFKLHPENGLMLTAMYRNHTYVTRCLGNLIGLGRLQSFVAQEVGVKVSSLTCISTHATIDTGEGWGMNEAGKLIRRAVKILENNLTGLVSV